MPRKRRSIEVFSLSFLDVICCGFGAMILLFILTAGQKAEEEEVAEVPVIDIAAIDDQLASSQAELSALQRAQAALREEIEELQGAVDPLRQQVDDLDDKIGEADALISDRESERDDLLRELEELEALPTPTIESEPVRRQFLTNFNPGGNRIVIFVEASGGMTGRTIDEASEWVNKPDSETRRAPEWQRVIRGMEWVLSSVDPAAEVLVVFFNRDVHFITPTGRMEWFQAGDGTARAEVRRKARAFTPNGGADMGRAFLIFEDMERPPDNIILLVDGLPNASAAIPEGSMVSMNQRQQLYNIAIQRLPSRVPINILLFPMEGDPQAPALFWMLASRTGGSFIIPTPDWPPT